MIVKGDANYRRVHGDRHWKATQQTNSITQYFPSSLLLLRTLKSDCLSGVSTTTFNRLNSGVDKDTWRVSGKYGLIQYLPVGGISDLPHHH